LYIGHADEKITQRDKYGDVTEAQIFAAE